MARHFARGVQESGGRTETTYLRNHNILPCSACSACMEHPENACILAPRDDAALIFRQIARAPLVFIAAPIFFYHLPAQLKAFIDRAQCLWAGKERARKAGLWSPSSALKPGMAGLVAARAKGEKLFEGSLLTLRYFLELFGVCIVESCLLTGYDQRGELDEDEDARERLFELGAKAQAIATKGAEVPHGQR